MRSCPDKNVIFANIQWCELLKTSFSLLFSKITLGQKQKLCPLAQLQHLTLTKTTTKFGTIQNSKIMSVLAKWGPCYSKTNQSGGLEADKIITQHAFYGTSYQCFGLDRMLVKSNIIVSGANQIN